ncbi:gamma-glutamyltransferase family protein [Oscillibacter hominis]|uniref:Gamma-glutamyltransferase family protein n=1 Tax=Oscillibacter hominis TaxID=2763056 RepID=A0A7G9B6C7_9FIRM|nr:gamma-glutamyltransferase family protein [Oscillibacter hominis]QNL45108.1 gamma-glutamyltransferase family protein [Oscillibacter hominis]
MNFDPLEQRYPSRRKVVFGRCAVAASQPLAAQAGLDVLKEGGNAVDAAIAAASVLTVAEPTSNGLGSDAFALIWSGKRLYGLNGSGRSPASISAQALSGQKEVPRFGWTPVTVPGAAGAWAELWRRFGRLPFPRLLQPAVDAARNGVVVQPTTARSWRQALELHRRELHGPEFKEWFRVFAPGGAAPRPGEIWHSEEHARTLEELARTECESLYRGDLAERIDRASRKDGGFLRKEDLYAYRPVWVEPIRMDYRGYEVCELPPNGCGVAALMALNILKNLSLGEREHGDTYHKLMESMKLAYIDAREYVADPEYMDYTPAELLSPDYGAARADLIGDQALDPAPGAPPKGGTVYFCTADAEGNMVSFIQSSYVGFGSAVVVPGTGITLQNRGCGFNLRPGHPNCLGGGKRPCHSILPGFLMKAGEAVGPFGVMGGAMQPQGHLQVVTNTIDFGLSPQDSLDAPRWQWTGGREILVEPGFSREIAEGLRSRGHEVRFAQGSDSFGRGQIIWRDPETGILCVGTESRCDSAAAVL